MQARLLKTGTALLLTASLAACGGGGGGTPGGGTGTTPTPPTTASFQSKFGTAFAGVFDSSNTSDPKDPAATDLPALNSSGDPLDN